jgi:predicted small lipoprotein YifL
MLHSKISYQTSILIVKSPLAFNLGAAVLLAVLLAGCGQPGPLFLPKPPAKPTPAASAVAPSAIPSTVPASPQ